MQQTQIKPYQNSKKEIDIGNIFKTIRHRVWIPIITAIIFTGLGYMYSHINQTLLYQSSTRIIIGADTDTMNTIMVVMTDPVVMNMVIEDLSLDKTEGGLAQSIHLQRLDDSQVIKMSVINKNPEMAADIANTTAHIFKKEIAKLLDFHDVKLLSDAEVNNNPINQNQMKMTFFGFVFGIFIGIGIIFLREAFNSTIKTKHDIEQVLQMSNLGMLANIKRRKNRKNQKRKLIKYTKGSGIYVKKKRSQIKS